MMNVLSLNRKRVTKEEGDEQSAAFIETLGMVLMRCPFKHVHYISGSFQCATVDLVRQEK